jgi:hypothetical protein
MRHIHESETINSLTLQVPLLYGLKSGCMICSLQMFGLDVGLHDAGDSNDGKRCPISGELTEGETWRERERI